MQPFRGLHGRRRGFAGSGQEEVEACSLPHRGFHGQVAPVALDDREGGGQAEAHAVLLGREEGIEDLGEVFRRDAAALVLHGDPHVAARLEGQRVAFGDRDVLPPHADQAAFRHGLVGVDDQVLDHLGDLPGIELPRPQVLGEQTAAARAGAPQHERCRLLDQLRQAAGLLHGQPALGEGDELPGQVAGPQGGPLHLLQAGMNFLGGVGVHLGQGDVAHDGGQEVVEVVGDSPGQAAYRLHLLHLLQVLLQGFALAQVAGHPVGSQEVLVLAVALPVVNALRLDLHREIRGLHGRGAVAQAQLQPGGGPAARAPLVEHEARLLHILWKDDLRVVPPDHLLAPVPQEALEGVVDESEPPLLVQGVDQVRRALHQVAVLALGLLQLPVDGRLLPGQAPLLQRIGHPLAQLLPFHRLADVVVSPALQGRHRRVDRAHPRDHDRQQLRVVLPDEAEHVLPAHVGQHQVQEDQLVAAFRQAAQGLPTAAGRFQLAALVGQQLPHALAHAGLVVHDQNAPIFARHTLTVIVDRSGFTLDHNRRYKE